MQGKSAFAITCVLLLIAGISGSLAQNNSSYLLQEGETNSSLLSDPFTPNATEFMGDNPLCADGDTGPINMSEPVPASKGDPSEVVSELGLENESSIPEIILNGKEKNEKEKAPSSEDEIIIRFGIEPGKKMNVEAADKAHKDASAKAKKGSKVKEDFKVKKDVTVQPVL